MGMAAYVHSIGLVPIGDSVWPWLRYGSIRGKQALRADLGALTSASRTKGVLRNVQPDSPCVPPKLKPT
jgi:hypothetical protein